MQLLPLFVQCNHFYMNFVDIVLKGERKMNKVRRKQITEIIDRLNDIQADLDCIYDDECDYLENIPENFQSSSRYETAENACEELENARSYIDDVINSLESARDGE